MVGPHHFPRRGLVTSGGADWESEGEYRTDRRLTRAVRESGTRVFGTQTSGPGLFSGAKISCGRRRVASD
eukprot:2854425-Rhodomonas_salina.1